MTTMVDPVVEEKTATDKPEIFHYMRKETILESTVFGVFGRAICGVRFKVTKTPPPNAQICPDCKDLYERMNK